MLYRFIFSALFLFLGCNTAFAQLSDIEIAQNELAEVRKELERVGARKEAQLFDKLKAAPPKKFINGTWVSSREALEIINEIDVLNKTQIAPLTDRRQKLIEKIKKLWASPQTKIELKEQFNSSQFSIEELEAQLKKAESYQERLYLEDKTLLEEKKVMANYTEPIQKERDVLKGGVKNLEEKYPERSGLQNVMRDQINVVSEDLRATQKVSRAIKISRGPVETAIAENKVRLSLLRSALESARAKDGVTPASFKGSPRSGGQPRLLSDEVVKEAKPLLPTKSTASKEALLREQVALQAELKTLKTDLVLGPAKTPITKIPMEIPKEPWWKNVMKGFSKAKKPIP